MKKDVILKTETKDILYPQTKTSLLVNDDGTPSKIDERINSINTKLEEKQPKGDYATNEKVGGIDTRLSNVENGTTIVPKATHAVNSDNANKADADGMGNNIADTYAKKKDIGESIKTIVYCKDEVEVTNETGCSKGLALQSDNTLVELLMLNGQTRRKSPNIFKIEDGIIEEKYGITFSANKNIISIKGTMTDDSDGWGGYVIPIKQIAKNFAFKIEGDLSNLNLKQSSLFFYDTIVSSEIIRFDNEWHYIDTSKMANNRTLRIQLYQPCTIDLKLKIMVSDEPLEGVPYQPYDDTLVSSNSNLISTGVNLCDEEWETGRISNGESIPNNENKHIRSKNYIPVIPNKEYVLVYYADVYGTISLYDKDKKFIDYWGFDHAEQKILTKEQMKDVYFVKIMLRQEAYNNSLMLNYGSTPQSYKPYFKDEIKGIGELKAFDYIDNKTLEKHIRTSKVITLNGSEGWILGGQLFYILLDVKGIKNDTTINIVSNNYPNVSLNDLYGDENGIAVSDDQCLIRNNSLSSIEEFKTWLSQNPIQLVYQLATENIIDMSSNPLPYTMRVSKGGLQVQESVGGGLPYEITKMYSINTQAQVETNTNTNVRQDEEISKLKNRTYNLENSKANKSYVDEQLKTKQNNLTPTQLANIDDVSNKQPKGDYATRTELGEGLATKQPTGDYALKSDIPTNNNQLINGAGYIKNEPDAFDYNNLKGKPTISEGVKLYWHYISIGWGGYVSDTGVGLDGKPDKMFSIKALSPIASPFIKYKSFCEEFINKKIAVISGGFTDTKSNVLTNYDGVVSCFISCEKHKLPTPNPPSGALEKWHFDYIEFNKGSQEPNVEYEEYNYSIGYPRAWEKNDYGLEGYNISLFEDKVYEL